MVFENIPEIKKATYKYWGFGLCIISDIEFPELLPYKFEQADVRIQIGKVPQIASDNQFTATQFLYTLTDNELVFKVDDVATYLVQNGNLIIIQPDAGLTAMRLLRLFVLATALAAILMQRDSLPIHASAILHNGKLLLITGDSGAGKSTSLAGLSKKGYTVFSDDVVVADAAAKITASYPLIKLWEDTQQKLDHDNFQDQSFVIKPGMNKYGIFFHDKFNTGAYDAQKVLILKKGDVSAIECRKIMDAEAFLVLNKQIYRPVLVHNNKLRARVFQTISKLANTCQVYEITRPEVCNVDDLVQQIETLLI